MPPRISTMSSQAWAKGQVRCGQIQSHPLTAHSHPHTESSAGVAGATMGVYPQGGRLDPWNKSLKLTDTLMHAHVHAGL